MQQKLVFVNKLHIMDNNIENAVAARRALLAEMLKNGKPVAVTATGEVMDTQEAAEQGLSNIQPPEGKLA